MMYLRLIYDFLLIGILSFGGGYTTIPMVKDIVDKYDALNMEMLENFIAISESTPGPIAINLATFVGNEVAGILGGILVTIFEVLPAFIIILVFVKYFKKHVENDNVKYALSIIRPCIVGVIMSVGVYMLIGIIHVNLLKGTREIAKVIIIVALVIISQLIYKRVRKKKISSIKTIILGAIFGIAINYLI